MVTTHISGVAETLAHSSYVLKILY